MCDSISFVEKCKNIVKQNHCNRALLELYITKPGKILLVEGKKESLDKIIYSDAIEIKKIWNDVKVVSIGSKKHAEIIIKQMSHRHKIKTFLDRDKDKPEINLTKLYSIESYFVEKWKCLVKKEHHNEFCFLANEILEDDFKQMQDLKNKLEKISKGKQYKENKNYEFQITEQSYKNNVFFLLQVSFNKNKKKTLLDILDNKKSFDGAKSLLDIWEDDKNNGMHILKEIAKNLKKIEF